MHGNLKLLINSREHFVRVTIFSENESIAFFFFF